MSADLTFLRDDEETEVFVTYRMTSAGCPAHMGSMTYPGHPEEPPEFEVDTVENAEGQEISSMLTDAEWTRLDDEVFEHGCDHADAGPDPDDLRDAAFDRDT